MSGMLNACPVEQAPATPSEPIDLDAVEKELAELSAHLDAATHRQLTLIRLIDESGLWARQGAKSCAHWLNWRIGLDLGAAREKVRVARALVALPAIDEALRKAELSYAKARAMTRVAEPRNEAALLEIAQTSTANQLERVCRGVRKANAEDPSNPEAPERSVRLRHRGEPTTQLLADLLPDEAERVMEAIRAMRQSMFEGSGGGEGAQPTLADALVRIADVVLAEKKEDHEATRTDGADRAQVVVHLTPDVLGDGYSTTLDDGTAISAETFRRLACDCSVLSVLRNGEGSILDIGRKTRNIPAAIRRAVRLRDECKCAFPGCTHVRFIHEHHCEHWMHGGETKLDNLVALCTFHHRLVHEAGWRVQIVDGKPRFFRPDGTPHDATPRAAEAPDDPLAAFEEQHAELCIHEETGLTRWDGTPPDYRAAVREVCGLTDDELGMSVSEWLNANGFEREQPPDA